MEIFTKKGEELLSNDEKMDNHIPNLLDIDVIELKN